MAATNSITQSGNRIVLTFDGIQVGLVQSIRVAEDYAPEPANGIGDIGPLEWVPTMARYQAQVTKMILRNEQLRKAGITFQDANDALAGRVFDILVIDKDTKAVLRKIGGCSFAQGDTEVRKNAIVMANITFMALSVSGNGL